MYEPLDEAYFIWLCARVRSRKQGHEYDGLLTVLHRTPFEWLVLGDRNRVADGLELREFFVKQTRHVPDPEWMEAQCSVLEMLIAFSRRASFQTDISQRKWFWTFIENLGLDDYRYLSDDDVLVVEEILNTFVWRDYSPSGDGGIFPMRRPNGHDQREVEIWYQFFQYLEDQGLM